MRPYLTVGTLFLSRRGAEEVVERANCLMTSDEMQRALMRISHEILEQNDDLQSLYLVGIHRRGIPLAERIQRNLEKIEGIKVPLGTLDITFYRDDLSLLSESPMVGETRIQTTVHDHRIILVDDVIYTGRTVRAAIEALFDLGRPRKIELACLIDRGHRELPIRPNYVGKNLPTSRSERVEVILNEVDRGEEGVYLFKDGGSSHAK